MGNFTPSDGSASEDLLIFRNVSWDANFKPKNESFFSHTRYSLRLSPGRLPGAGWVSEHALPGALVALPA